MTHFKSTKISNLRFRPHLGRSVTPITHTHQSAPPPKLPPSRPTLVSSSVSPPTLEYCGLPPSPLESTPSVVHGPNTHHSGDPSGQNMTTRHVYDPPPNHNQTSTHIPTHSTPLKLRRRSPKSFVSSTHSPHAFFTPPGHLQKTYHPLPQPSSASAPVENFVIPHFHFSQHPASSYCLAHTLHFATTKIEIFVFSYPCSSYHLTHTEIKKMRFPPSTNILHTLLTWYTSSRPKFENCVSGMFQAGR